MKSSLIKSCYYESSNDLTIRNIFIFGLIFSLLAPYSLLPPPYVSQYIVQITVSFLVLALTLLDKGKTQKSSCPPGLFIFSFITILLAIISGINTLFESNSLYDFRDSVRPFSFICLLFAIFLSSKKINHLKFAKQIYFICGIYILINSFISIIWIFDKTYIDTVINLFVSPSDPVFYAGYWRYTGLSGQPNFNAISTFTVGLFVLLFPAKSKFLKYFILFSTIPVLIFSSSRTVFAALTIITILKFTLSSKSLFTNMRFSLFHFLVVSFLFVLFISVFITFFDADDYFTIRISTVFDYSDDDRRIILYEFIDYFLHNPLHFLFGKLGDINISGYSFTDNDYLLLITKYGFLQSINIFICIFLFSYSASIKARKNPTNKLIAFGFQFFIWYIVFALIVSIASAIVSAPSLIYLPLICLSFILNNRHNISLF